MTTVIDRVPPLRGGARAKKLAIDNERSVRKETARLLAGLKREHRRKPTTAETIEAELLAIALVRSRHLRSTGRSDTAERLQIERLLHRGSAFYTVPAPSPAELQHGPEVAAAIDAAIRNHPARRFAPEND